MKTSVYHLHSILIGAIVVGIAYCENIVQNNNTKSSEEIILRLHDLENKVKGLEAVLQESKVHKRSITGENVAFSTLLSINQDHVGLGQTIKFDKVLLNDGHGYSALSGIFTAPKEGVYMFSYFFAHGYSDGQVWLELLQNGKKINAGVTDTFHTDQDLQGGNVAIIRVQSGERVWVQSFHQNDASIYGIPGFTTFSGVLLY